MELNYRTIDPEQDRETLIEFFRQVRIASGDTNENFDWDRMVAGTKERVVLYPDGYVFAEEDGRIVGVLWLRIKEYEEREVGSVSLIYMIPEVRGQGHSRQMLDYAETFFVKRNMNEYHLLVAQTNQRALRFYEKSGLKKIAEETNSLGVLSYRMGKNLQ